MIGLIFWPQGKANCPLLSNSRLPPHNSQALLVKFVLPLLVSSLAFLGGCSQDDNDPNNQKTPSTGGQHYQTYEHQGLTLDYPDHWVLKFDGTPDFSDDRAVIFDASELSRVSLHITRDSVSSLTSIADHYVEHLGLEKGETIKHYQRAPVALGGYEGLRLTWQETEFFKREVEVTILKVLDPPTAIFVVFDLDEEDVKKEAPNIVPFTKNIMLHRPKTRLP